MDTQKGRKHMATELIDKIQKLVPHRFFKEFKVPPERVQENIEKNKEHFNGLSSAMYDVFNEGLKPDPKFMCVVTTYGRSHISNIIYNHMKGHPLVPPAYYDEIKDGVLHVIDQVTGNLIPKAEAYLTSFGDFRSKDTYPTFNSLTEESKEKIKRFLDKNTEPLSYFAFTDEGYAICRTFQVDMEEDVLSTTIGSLLPFLIKTFHTIPYSDLETFSITEYKKFCRKVRSSVKSRGDRFLKLVKKKDLTPNAIYLEGDILNGIYLDEDVPNNIKKAADSYKHSEFLKNQTPVLYLNSLSHRYSTSNLLLIENETGLSRRYLENTIFLRDLGIKTDFNFELGFLVLRGARTPSVRNVVTENSQGHPLNYFAKAPRLKKSFIKKESETKPCWLGLEWEVECSGLSSEKRAALIQNIANSTSGEHVIMKSDGSLDRTGFEIVTVPATLSVHKEKLSRFFDEDTQFNKNFMSSHRTGIHIHIDTNQFSDMGLGKLISFINKNENRQFIELLSGRKMSAPFHPPIDVELNTCVDRHKTIGVDISARIGLRGKSISGHHSCVCTSAPTTIELRFFKSTNVKSILFRRLEFAECITKFVTSANHSIQQMTVYDFVNFCLETSNRKRYPYLLSWLAAKGYIEKERVRVKGQNLYKNRYRTVLVDPPKNNVYHSKHFKSRSMKQVTVQ